jgi:hypothetical protein
MAIKDCIMKVAISGLVGLSLLAGLAEPADAGARAKKKRHEAPQAVKQYRGEQGSDYIERLADKLPFGSSTWWDQMVRERRGGRAG